MRRWASVVTALLLVGCAGSNDRDDARNSLIQQLVDGGLQRSIAECVVDAFFEDKTDEELKGFFDRKQLTPEEAAEFAALGSQCAPPAS